MNGWNRTSLLLVSLISWTALPAAAQTAGCVEVLSVPVTISSPGVQCLAARIGAVKRVSL